MIHVGDFKGAGSPVASSLAVSGWQLPSGGPAVQKSQPAGGAVDREGGDFPVGITTKRPGPVNGVQHGPATSIAGSDWVVCFSTIIAKRREDQSHHVSCVAVTVGTCLDNLVTSVPNWVAFGVLLPQLWLLHLRQNQICTQLRYRSSFLTERRC